MMLAAATKMKAIAPDTKIYIYRNLAQAYSNFVQVNGDSRLICRAVRLANPKSITIAAPREARGPGVFGLVAAVWA